MKKENNWIEEFDDKFPATHNIFPSNKKGYLTISEYSVSVDDIKSFIANLLLQQKAELLKELEGRLPKEHNYTDCCQRTVALTKDSTPYCSKCQRYLSSVISPHDKVLLEIKEMVKKYEK